MERKTSTAKRKQSHCFVVGCKSGYKSCKNKISLFKAPSDAEMLGRWQKAIPRADKVLETFCSVCELHFEPHFIDRFYRTIIAGKEVLQPRGKPLLSKDAVPSIFPDVPKYLSISIPKKRATKTSLGERTTKKVKLNTDENVEIATHSSLIYLEDITSVCLPSPYWVCIKYQQTPNIVCFATWSIFTNGIGKADKSIMVKISDADLFCEIYFKHVMIRMLKLTTVSELQEIIYDIDKQYHCKGAGTINEFPNAANKLNVINNVNIWSNQCFGSVNSKETSCKKCKYQRKLLLNSRYYKHGQKKCTNTRNNLKILVKHAGRLKQRAIMLSTKLHKLKIEKQKFKNIASGMNTLPYKQKLAFSECVKASSRKSLKGIVYSKEWLLESIMRMKSPRLYEHMRVNKLLTLPSRTCIKEAMKHYQSGYGFNLQMFEILKQKLKYMDSFSRHGCILYDEMKLSENLKLNTNGTIQGFVDYGAYTPEASKRHQLCNHGLVLLFQPFVGDWVQILGVFGTKGNMSGMLGKVLIDAIILAEKAGLFVDNITGDGASWNRAMWREFGIGITNNGELRCKVPHPVDEQRSLHFISDFPHLLKCLRNSFLKTGFKTPEGNVRMEFIKAAWKEDEKLVRLKAMPKITKAHMCPNNFEKMKVNLAIQLFSTEVLKGIYLYEDVVKSQYGNPKPTIIFITKINKLIEIMTSRIARRGLQCGSKDFHFLEDFLQYIDKWEKCSGGIGFLSKSTSLGLRVTIHSTLSLVKYLTSNINYKYVLTSRLSQDKIENLFSIIRQCKGCNDHPTSAEFQTIIQCLSFYNLARPPRGANVEPSVLNCLIGKAPEYADKNVFSNLDDLLEQGELCELENSLAVKDKSYEHKQMIEQRSDIRLIFYIAGYVVRKFQKRTSCKACIESLEDADASCLPEAEYTKQFDLGGLKYPTKKVLTLINSIETKFTQCFSFKCLHRDSISDIISALCECELVKVGCSDHKVHVTQKIVKFFVMTRLHFFLKALNRCRDEKRERQRYLKMRRIN